MNTRNNNRKTAAPRFGNYTRAVVAALAVVAATGTGAGLYQAGPARAETATAQSAQDATALASAEAAPHAYAPGSPNADQKAFAKAIAQGLADAGVFDDAGRVKESVSVSYDGAGVGKAAQTFGKNMNRQQVEDYIAGASYTPFGYKVKSITKDTAAVGGLLFTAAIERDPQVTWDDAMGLGFITDTAQRAKIRALIEGNTDLMSRIDKDSLTLTDDVYFLKEGAGSGSATGAPGGAPATTVASWVSTVIGNGATMTITGIEFKTVDGAPRFVFTTSGKDTDTQGMDTTGYTRRHLTADQEERVKRSLLQSGAVGSDSKTTVDVAVSAFAVGSDLEAPTTIPAGSAPAALLTAIDDAAGLLVSKGYAVSDFNGRNASVFRVEGVADTSSPLSPQPSMIRKFDAARAGLPLDAQGRLTQDVTWRAVDENGAALAGDGTSGEFERAPEGGWTTGTWRQALTRIYQDVMRADGVKSITGVRYDPDKREVVFEASKTKPFIPDPGVEPTPNPEPTPEPEPTPPTPEPAPDFELGQKYKADPAVSELFRMYGKRVGERIFRAKTSSVIAVALRDQNGAYVPSNGKPAEVSRPDDWFDAVRAIIPDGYKIDFTKNDPIEFNADMTAATVNVVKGEGDADDYEKDIHTAKTLEAATGNRDGKDGHTGVAPGEAPKALASTGASTDVLTGLGLGALLLGGGAVAFAARRRQDGAA